MTATLAPAICEAPIAQTAGTHGMRAVLCRQSRYIRSWHDAAGTLHRACPKHLAQRTALYAPADAPWPGDLPHGTLGLGSSWTKALFPGDRRAAVEEQIPDGYRIDVAAVAGRPGPWRVRAVATDRFDDEGRPLEVIPWTLTRDPHGLVTAMALRL